MKIKEGWRKLAGYRLLTEAESEYVCRAGSDARYGFGEPAELLEEYAGYSKNSWGHSHANGLLKPNDLGLFDMHGNVWKWTQTRYTDKVPDEVTDPGEVVDEATNRVFRGGSWFDVAGNWRAAFRSRRTPGTRIYELGFRLARVPVKDGKKYIVGGSAGRRGHVVERNGDITVVPERCRVIYGGPGATIVEPRCDSQIGWERPRPRVRCATLGCDVVCRWRTNAGRCRFTPKV